MKFKIDLVSNNLDYMIKDNRILDLASHTGESSIGFSKIGARSVLGVEPRYKLVNQSTDLAYSLGINNVKYLVGDATNKDQLIDFLKNIDTVATFGMFYHIADHNLLLKTICESLAKHVIIETEYGPETKLPGIDWYVENTDFKLAGYNGYDRILAGAPNLKWINDCLSVYNWKIVYYCAFYQDFDAPTQRQRMMIAAVNLKNYSADKIKPLPDDLWEWHVEPDQIIAKTFNGFKYEI